MQDKLQERKIAQQGANSPYVVVQRVNASDVEYAKRGKQSY